MDEDDFYGDSEPTSSDYIVEQRATERLLIQHRASGYRDGHQKLMEDEPHLQLGFDIAYRLISKISYLLGQIKSFAIYSKFTKSNTAFLAQLNMHIDKLEKFNYELYLNWDNSKGDNKVEPEHESLCSLLTELHSRINKFRDNFLTINSQNLDNLNFSDLETTLGMKKKLAKYVNNDLKQEKLEQEKVQGLNKMVNDIQFDF